LNGGNAARRSCSECTLLATARNVMPAPAPTRILGTSHRVFGLVTSLTDSPSRKAVITPGKLISTVSRIRLLQLRLVPVLDGVVDVQVDADDDSSKDDQTQKGCYHAPDFALSVCHVNDCCLMNSRCLRLVPAGRIGTYDRARRAAPNWLVWFANVPLLRLPARRVRGRSDSERGVFARGRMRFAGFSGQRERCRI